MEDLKKSLEALKETLNEEIKKVTKKSDITPTELENMTKAICLIEKIKMLEELDGYEDEMGMSGRHYPMRSYGLEWGTRNMPYSMSGRQGRASNGRYTSGTSYGMPDPGYSGHSIKDRMIAKLESMYDEAKTDHERQIVDEWISRLSDERR